MFMRHFFQIDSEKLEYLVFGEGRPLLALHGFADDAELFLGLKGYRVFAVSLPHHGKSNWKSDFNLSHLQRFIDSVLGNRSFSLLGFSMGGKIAICLATAMPERIDRLILLAPDGVATHRLYDSIFLGRYFKDLVVKVVEKRPRQVLALGAWARRRGLISKFVYDFGHNHLNSPLKRRRLFLTWKFLENFKPDLDAFAAQMNSQKTPVLLFLGKRDQIIKPETADFFVKNIPHTQILWLDKGHLLVDAALEELPNYVA